uniref:NADH dehydrogenase subunit 4L n=1 Tax=Siphonodentalium lobatum TaxID=203167 RepID=Q6VEH8_9MOLL|nr:NADH dehydrogenase subunit 4L [Siphonodentalium lobatum]AAP91670.1 NADH dehydrogenase subunit 4L [Siphonodentalium lobatum]
MLSQMLVLSSVFLIMACLIMICRQFTKSLSILLLIEFLSLSFLLLLITLIIWSPDLIKNVIFILCILASAASVGLSCFINSSAMNQSSLTANF